jgi:uncharacterized membrane protein YesL
LSLLSVNSRFVHFLEILFELVILNLLTLLCCAPIITTGVAISALYRSLFDMRQGNANIIRGYFKAFKDDLLPGLAFGLLLILLCVSFVLYLFLFQDLIASGDLLALVGIFFVAVIFFFPMTFVFPILAMFESPVIRILSNAFLLSFRHFGISLVVLLINGLPWALLMVDQMWFIRLLPLFVILGLSLPGWFASSLFLRVFKKYSEL